MILPLDCFASKEVNKKFDGFVVSMCLFLYLAAGDFCWNEEILACQELRER